MIMEIVPPLTAPIEAITKFISLNKSPIAKMATAIPATANTPIRAVFHCFLNSLRLSIVPIWTIIKPTIVCPKNSRDELSKRSVGKILDFLN